MWCWLIGLEDEMGVTYCANKEGVADYDTNFCGANPSCADQIPRRQDGFIF